MKFSRLVSFLVVLASSSNVLCLEKKNHFSRRLMNIQNPKASRQQKQIPVNLLPSFVSISTGGSTAVNVIAQTDPSSFIDKIWNDDTKLATYLAVWYLGNIYCEFGFMNQFKTQSLPFYFQTIFLTRRRAWLWAKMRLVRRTSIGLYLLPRCTFNCVQLFDAIILTCLFSSSWLVCCSSFPSGMHCIRAIFN
jgi:hypothetical protein